MAYESKSLCCCLAMLASIFLFTPAAAQMVGPLPTGKPPVDHLAGTDRPIRLDVAMVLVNVSVTDLQDRPLTNLRKDDFQVFENGVEQEILSFSHEDAPISIGLLFDMSGSMANKMDKAIRSALQVLKTANHDDEFFLVTFGNHARLVHGFTSNAEDLQADMFSAMPQGRTALLDAISLGVEQMRGARNRKRALVVISDGGDNHSRYNEARIRSDLKEADCQLYAMGVFDDSAAVHTREERKGPALLSEFAELTGGRAYSVSSAEELPEVADKISVELRDRYVLGYQPDSGARDGAWRTIKVKMANQAASPQLRIVSKTGYYGPKD